MTDAEWTWDSIIGALGGTGTVADALGVSMSTVSGWRTRPRGIPAESWSAVIGLASDRGKSEITLEVLAEVAARRAEATEARV